LKPEALDEVYSLLNPNKFELLDSLFINAANSILTNLPAKQKTQKTLVLESYSLELQQSAIKLKELIKPCFDELHHAEDVYNSKNRISKITKEEVFEQIGELSGRDLRIINLGKHCRIKAIEQVNKSWEQRINQLRKKWFIDAKQQPKQGIGWGDKEGFIKEIRPAVSSQSIDINISDKREFKHSLSRI
jgi:hypothetical protein